MDSQRPAVLSIGKRAGEGLVAAASAHVESERIRPVRGEEAIGKKYVVATAGNAIDRDVLDAQVRIRVDNSAAVIMVENGGGTAGVKSDIRVRVEDFGVVRQDKMQVQIGRAHPDELTADNAVAPNVHEATATVAARALAKLIDAGIE